MKYLLTICCFLLLIAKSSAQIFAPAQGGNVMKLLDSKKYKILDQRVVTHTFPVYEHKGNTLRADSGALIKDEIGREYFEAFGNIIITQSNGSTIYADRLHYEASTQHAILTKNVRVVDQGSVLTTNYLTYNFRDQRGTYTGGGRILSGEDTITSRNAYYFERTKDSYFREKVVVRSPNGVIYTDTMRYNSISRDNFFYGPTNLKGRGGENLYTERGVYNTGTGVAKFTKNNLFTEDSKFLKGDSLYYDRNKGYGEGFRNVVFIDTLEKFYANGGYGKYRQDEESITMADNPLIKMVVSNDSTKKEQSTVIASDDDDDKNLSRRERRRKRELEQLALKDNSTQVQDSLIAIPPIKREAVVDTVYMTADTIFSKMILAREYLAIDLKLNREGGQLIEEADEDYGDDDENELKDPVGAQKGALVEKTGEESADVKKEGDNELEDDKKIKEKPNDKLPSDTIPPRPVANKPGDIRKNPVVVRKAELTIQQTLKADSSLRSKAVVPKINEADRLIDQAMASVLSTESSTMLKDSTLAMSSDTTKTRILKAFHNVRLYKSDLQAVSDSVYYGMLDSMFRFMGKPMIWAEGSQISADTIFMQMVNQKLDNAFLKNNAFMVNTVLDTVKFNQLKGRKMTVFFENNSIERIFVDGNAENLMFSAEEELGIIRDMFHDKGSRFKILFKDKKLFRYSSIKPNQQVYPFKMVNAENEILPGFIWRPEDRPKSRDDMMSRKRDLYQLEVDTKAEEGKVEKDKDLQIEKD